MKVFKLPDLGEGVHEGQIVRISVREGEAVREDAPLMEVETDKASVEIPSPFTGVVQKVHVSEGQLVHVGDVMVTFGDSAPHTPSLEGGGQGVGEASRGDHTARTSGGATHPPAPSLGGRGSTSATVARSAHTSHSPHRRKPASPAVRKLARNFGLDIEHIDGSGPGGRITIRDVEQASQQRNGGAVSPSTGSAASAARQTQLSDLAPAPADRETTKLARPASPSFRSLARTTLEGTPGTPGNDTWGAIIRSPLSRIRKTIADAMTHSVRTIPHVTDTGDADITELDRLRKGYASADNERKLTMLPFVIRAVALALAKHPLFNASYDDERNEIIYHEYISIAVGVNTDRGLIAPVLREADRLSIAAISDELNILAENARSARFQVNDTRGGTFTVSNAGAVGGSRYSTPIVNHPQVAVLAIGRSKWMPWVVNPPEVEARLVMPLSLSFDHRIIDGGTSIPFLQDIISLLENPARLVL